MSGTHNASHLGVRSPEHIGEYMRSGKKQKQSVVLKRLQKYINKYHSSHSNLDIKETTNADELVPYRTVSNEDFVGKYAMFMATEATHLDNSGQLLCLSTTLQYLSSFSEYYINKYRNQ